MAGESPEEERTRQVGRIPLEDEVGAVPGALRGTGDEPHSRGRGHGDRPAPGRRSAGFRGSAGRGRRGRARIPGRRAPTSGPAIASSRSTITTSRRGRTCSSRLAPSRIRKSISSTSATARRSRPGRSRPSATRARRVGDWRHRRPAAACIPRLMKVEAGSAGERSGLKAGDILLSVDGQPLTFQAQFRKAIAEHPELPMIMVVRRDGVAQTLTVTPGTKDGDGRVSSACCRRTKRRASRPVRFRPFR